MTDDKRETKKKTPDFISQVVMSEAALNGMSLNNNDRQWLERYTNLRDDVVKDNIKRIRMDIKKYIDLTYDKNSRSLCLSMAEIVAAQNKKMFDILDGQTKMIKEIASDIKLIQADVLLIKDRLDIIEGKVETDGERIGKLEKDVKHLNNYASIRWTIIRWSVVVIIAVLSFLVLHYAFIEPLHHTLK